MRLIDAERLKRGIRSHCAMPTWCHELVKAEIDEQPTTEADPVVRCGECKKHSDVDGKHYCKFWRMYCPDDSDFSCKAGERKNGDGNG